MRDAVAYTAIHFRDLSNPPKQITNEIGRIYLRIGDSTQPGMFPRMLPAGSSIDDNTSDALASGFDILVGKAEITVPTVPTGSNYRLVRE